MRAFPSAAAVLLLLASTACLDSTAVSLYPLDPKSFTPQQRELQQRVLEAYQAAVGDLFRGSSEALAEGGPAAAAEVCRQATLKTATARQSGDQVVVGLALTRPLNPANAVPGWGESSLKDTSSRPRFFSGPGGRFGALFPRQMPNSCRQCHTSGDRMKPEVRDLLSRSYALPDTVDFVGAGTYAWFWVEVQG